MTIDPPRRARKRQNTDTIPADEPFGIEPSLTLTEINVWKKHYANRPATGAPVPRSAVAHAASTARSRDEAPEATIGPAEPTRLPILSGDDRFQFEPVTWIVGDSARDGTTLIYGAPKTGKTSLFVDTANAAGSGQSAWGEPTFGNPKTLYLATEDLEGAKRALAASCIARGISKAECRVDIVDTRSINIPQISNAGNMAIVRDTLVAGGYKIFAVDVMAFATAGENMADTEKVAAALRYVKPLYEQDGISTWLLTHSTKDGKSYFGGVLLLGSVYQAWEVTKEGGQISLTNIAMRGAAQVDGSLVFEAQSIDLPGELDNRGRKPNAMFPKFLHRGGTGRDIETKAGREIQVKYILAALRSSAGKHWRVKELAIECRVKDCPLGVKALENKVLKRTDGWAVKHPILAPYYHNASEEWRTPSVLPPLPVGYGIPTDDDAPDDNGAPDGKVVPIQRRRRKAA